MKKNIAIMTWSLNTGGAERAAANLSKDLSDEYNVYLMVFDSKNIVYPYFGTLLDIGYDVQDSKIKKIFNFFKRCKKILKFKKMYNISIVISFMPQINIYNVVTKRKSKAIVSIRNNMSYKNMSKIKKKIMKYVGQKADMTISLSDGVKEDLINNFEYPANKIMTIYNSCDIKWFLRENKEIDKLIDNFDFNCKTIVTVGRTTYQKGQWHLLRAFKKVVDVYPDAKLIVFGEGELKEKLINYTEKLEISNNVFFLGYMKNHHKFLMKCDVFVFSSIYEGLGNVILEALACGLPVISTDCNSGPSELLNESFPLNSKDIIYAKYGILTPTFSLKEFNINDFEYEKADLKLSEAILKVFEDDKISNYYKEQAYKRSYDFKPDKIKSKWIDIIENL